MALRVYNTLTRQKEEFRPVEPGKVRMYVCGPTVYKPSHIGHMVGPVIFDTVKRFLTYLGYQVTWVVNITDVDDKLIVRARELGTTVKELAERMTADYLDCLKKLNATGIDHMPRATEHIPEMIEIMRGLIDKGHAYASGGDVYFDVTSDPDYGKLCNRDPEQLEAGSRIEVSEKKRNPGDFALWKASKPGEPSWDSPWGPGRPGWHIECSAMSMKLLGKTLDIHGGGLDLQFPHHENELAQSESFTGQTFSRYWMHNGLLKMGQTKMAGSIGNVVNIVDLLQRHSAETVRFLLLGTHYRSPIEYSEDRLAEVRRSLEGFYRFFERYQRIRGRSFYELTAPAKQAPFDIGASPSEFLNEVSRLRSTFLDCMSDDFNTGGAIGALYELLTTLNRFADAKKLEYPNPGQADLSAFDKGTLVLKELSQILGLFHEVTPRVSLHAESGMIASGAVTDREKDQLIQLLNELGAAPPTNSAWSESNAEELIQKLIDLRMEARKSKKFAISDQIRQRLGQVGITLEDRPGGTGWRRG
ncbi:MAG TPA: cysteine--tRNA ligase [Gemmataceae bacterium]|nr:cysteine--tRNA ligase [Gemmataceae bacterium]